MWQPPSKISHTEISLKTVKFGILTVILIPYILSNQKYK